MQAETADIKKNSSAPILWDVVGEHLDEAEFLFEQWERRLRSPKATLKQLESTVEKRLEAHLDGLLIGGEEVAERTLMRELENASQPARATVAAIVLLYQGENYSRRVVETAIATETPIQKALCRALILSNASGLDQRLTEHFYAVETEQQKATLLNVLTGRGINVGATLNSCLASSENVLVVAALDATRRFGRRDRIKEVEYYLRSENTTLRECAIKAGIVLGSQMAWGACLEQISTGNVCDPELGVLLAVAGVGYEHDYLFKKLAQDGNIENVLWTIGYCGTRPAAELCLHYLQSSDLRRSKIAADSLAWMGGFNLMADAFQRPEPEPTESETLPSFESDDLNKPLLLDGVDDLPAPNVTAIQSWWEKQKDSLFDERTLLGSRLSAPVILQALESGVLWRRGGLALEISWRTAGQRHLSTDVFTSRQRKQLAALGSTPLIATPWS